MDEGLVMGWWRTGCLRCSQLRVAHSYGFIRSTEAVLMSNSKWDARDRVSVPDAHGVLPGPFPFYYDGGGVRRYAVTVSLELHFEAAPAWYCS